MRKQTLPSIYRVLPSHMFRTGAGGLGQSNVNPTTIWTPSGGWFATPGDASTAATPQPVAPGHVPVPACTQDTRSGGAAFSAECIAAVLAAQQQNMAADSAANKSVFVANCNSDWEANAAAYRARGMAVPPNDCAYRGYGLTQPGTTGSFVGYVAGTPQEIIDWRNANPGGGSPGPAAGGPVQGSPGVPQLSFTNLTSGDNSNFKVGDRWQVVISGAQPGRGVSLYGGKDGVLANSQMGLVDSSGRFTLNGQMDQGQVGSWSEAWAVNNQQLASFSFKVSPGSTTAPPSTSNTGAGGPILKTPAAGGAVPSIQNTLGGTVSIGGIDVPVWGLGLAGVAILFFMMRGR